MGIFERPKRGLGAMTKKDVVIDVNSKVDTPRKIDKAPEKVMVGRVLSIWDGPFSGDMLNFGGVVGKEPLLMFCFDSMDDSELQKTRN